MARPWTQRALSCCASTTPCQELALKDLSESFPTSVTSPTLVVLEHPDEELELVPPPPQAKTTRTAAARTARRPKPLITDSRLLSCGVAPSPWNWRQHIAWPARQRSAFTG